MIQNRYVIKFTKNGYVKYTSHLDLLRLFKRTFKKTGISLKYSQGFNPHPKMGFAQPLSLGYSSRCELIEFETEEKRNPEMILSILKNEMPEGIDLISCIRFDSEIKSLASDTVSCLYKIWIPTERSENELKENLNGFLTQEKIIAQKRQKKSKELKEIDIKPMIRELSVMKLGDFACLDALLDCGSQSNLSPEQVISAFMEYTGIDTKRHEIEVERIRLNFESGLKF